MKKAAKFVVRFRWWFFGAFVIAAVVCAFLSQKVVINYDFKKYLPSDSGTNLALKILDDEGFDYNSTISVMLKGDSVPKTEQIAANLLAKLNENATDGQKKVSAVTYKYSLDQDGAAEYSLLQIAVVGDELSPQSKEIAKEVSEILQGEDYEISGGIVHNIDLEEAIGKDIPLILAICVAIVLLILICTSKSWVDPLIFFAVIGIGIVINMGTNLIFGEISYITQSVAAILQLALAMDYSIILLHSFEKFRDEGNNVFDAAEKSLCSSFSAIFSSSLTTIAGLVALMFMTFTIGFDIGMVLMKGIVISMLTVFLFMPSLLICLKKGKEKTHKTVPMPAKTIAKCGWKTRNILPLVMVVVVALAAVLNFGHTNYSFKVSMEKNSGAQEIVDVFGYDNLIMVVAKNRPTEQESLALQGELISFLKDYEGFCDENGNNTKLKSVYSFVYQYTEEQLVGITNMDRTLARSLYTIMNRSGGTVSLQEIAVFSQMKLSNGLLSMTVNPTEFASMTGVSEANANLFYLSRGYAIYNNEVPFGILLEDLHDPTTQTALTVASGTDLSQTFALVDQMYAQKEYFAALDLNAALASFSDMFLGENYNRIMFSVDMPQSTDETFEFFDALTKKLSSGNFADVEVLTVGESSVSYDIANSFDGDKTKTGLITVFAILIIIGLVYRSLSLPFILILVIQGAVWISMAINALSATPVFFMSYIIVSCILMGATIDYGILMSNTYIKNRRLFCRREAMEQAVKTALPTVLTSGVIMIVCGFCVGLISSVEAIYTVGYLLGRGAIASVLMILFVLPSILILTDKILFKTTLTSFKPMKEGSASNGASIAVDAPNNEVDGTSTAVEVQNNEVDGGIVDKEDEGKKE